jgi:hypothetical protein
MHLVTNLMALGVYISNIILETLVLYNLKIQFQYERVTNSTLASLDMSKMQLTKVCVAVMADISLILVVLRARWWVCVRLGWFGSG